MKRDQRKQKVIGQLYRFNDPIVQECAYTERTTEIITKLTAIATAAQGKKKLTELSENECFALCYALGAPWETAGERDGGGEHLIMRLTVPCVLQRKVGKWTVTGETKG